MTQRRTRDEFMKAVDEHYPQFDPATFIGTGGGSVIYVSSEDAEVLTGLITNRNTLVQVQVIMVIDCRGDFEMFTKW